MEKVYLLYFLEVRKGGKMDSVFSWLDMPVFWLAAAIIFVVIEGLTMGLTTIWFAGGAVVALAASLLGAGLAVQLVLFFAVSIVLLLSTRKIFVKKLHTGRTKTNVDALIGKEAIVIRPIRPMEGGLIKLGGQEWTAVCRENVSFETGEKVKVKAIEGVKAIVEPLKEE